VFEDEVMRKVIGANKSTPARRNCYMWMWGKRIRIFS